MLGPLPTLVPQLDGSPQSKVNCGPASTASLLSHADVNLFVPTPSQVRARGQMGTGPTDMADQKRAVATYGPEFASLGLDAPVLIRLGYITAGQLVQTLVRPRFDHLVAISYAVVVDQGRQYAGDKDYRGAHFVTCCRIYQAIAFDSAGEPTRFHRVRPRELERALQRMGLLYTVVVDPIADGRRPSIPRAPLLWPLELLLAAGDAFHDTNPRDGRMPVALIDRAPSLPEEQS